MHRRLYGAHGSTSEAASASPCVRSSGAGGGPAGCSAAASYGPVSCGAGAFRPVPGRGPGRPHLRPGRNHHLFRRPVGGTRPGVDAPGRASSETGRPHRDSSPLSAHSGSEPHLGYELATAVAQEVLTTGRSVKELVLDKGLLTKDELQVLLHPDNLARPHAGSTAAAG
ncbi:hypothetical protein [Streptomyces sannanensis]|uniref:hypothetical protein n=1 Tax=Streptomyces sannanensis TaxID=285536 RepID=UPI0031EF1AA1